jgi:histidyl-tRNA synthetase
MIMSTALAEKKAERKVRKTLKERGWLSEATEVASYYGFNLIESPRLSRSDAEVLKLGDLRQLPLEDRSGIIRVEHAAGALRRFMIDMNLEGPSVPSLLAFATPLRNGRNAFSLEAIGSPKSVAEAMILKTASVILAETGVSPSIAINSLGDKDCSARFSRELSSFYRRHINSLSEHCRTLLRRDSLLVFGCKNKECQTLKEEAPKPMSYLSEPSRKHFKETLEYLESLGLPYSLVNNLVGQPPYSGKTIFEIYNGENLIGRGGRYDILGRAFGAKKEVPAVGLSLFFETAPGEVTHNAARKPRIYFVQLGFEAKLRALEVVEVLRQAKVPMAQAVIKEKLTAQLEAAGKLGIPYMVIMGQKEALDHTVIVRHAETRVQEIVPIADLARHIKDLK